MQVNRPAGEIARTDTVQRPAAPASMSASDKLPSAAPRADQVDISAAGRALADDAAPADTSSTLDPRRADEIRAKILSGVYDSAAMADQVARSILRSGDL